MVWTVHTVDGQRDVDGSSDEVQDAAETMGWSRRADFQTERERALKFDC